MFLASLQMGLRGLGDFQRVEEGSWVVLSTWLMGRNWNDCYEGGGDAFFAEVDNDATGEGHLRVGIEDVWLSCHCFMSVIENQDRRGEWKESLT